jgi:dipeptidyl aminopeptidase/acylaminoacyl peptidase
VLPYLPFALLYAAVGLDHIRRRGTRRLAGVLIVISTIAGLFSNRAQFLDPVSDGFQWAKRSGLAWRERLRDGDKVGDRKPYFSFYAGAEYVKIPLAPYDETIEHLAASHVKLLMLHRDTIDPLRPAIAPLLHNGAVIRGELRYRQVEVENGTYILYERTDARGTLQTERVTARVPGMLVTPSWSPDGRMLAYRWVSSSGAGAVLTVAVEGGESRRVFDGTGLIDPLTWSPDSKSICFATGEDETLDICALDLATGGLKRVVKHAAADRSPCWSKDGREIVFSSSRSGREEIWSQSLDTGEVTQLTHNGGNTLPALSPDGQRVALVNRARRLVILDRETGRTHVVGDPETVASAPAWSPDGRFIAVTSAERSGGADVYLIDSRGLQSLVLTKTTEGEGMPTWSPDGSRLAVVSNDSGDFGIWVLSGLEPYLERLTSTDPIETLSRMQ